MSAAFRRSFSGLSSATQANVAHGARPLFQTPYGLCVDKFLSESVDRPLGAGKPFGQICQVGLVVLASFATRLLGQSAAHQAPKNLPSFTAIGFAIEMALDRIDHRLRHFGEVVTDVSKDPAP